MKQVETDVPAIERGDVVVLKSGGPLMTVIRRTEGAVVVVWFVGGAAEMAFFPLGAVRLASCPLNTADAC